MFCVIVGASTGWYISRMPVTLPVIALYENAEDSVSRPTAITEFSSWSVLYEIRKNQRTREEEKAAAAKQRAAKSKAREEAVHQKPPQPSKQQKIEDSLEILKTSKDQGDIADALAFLITAQPTTQIVQRSLELLNDDQFAEKHYYARDLVHALLQSEFLKNPSQKSNFDHFKKRMLFLAEEHFDRGRSDHYFDWICWHGSADFLELLESKTKPPRQWKRRKKSFGALLRLGEHDEVLRARTNSLITEAFHKEGKINSDIYQYYFDQYGPEATRATLLKQSNRRPMYWMLCRIAELTNSNNEEQVKETTAVLVRCFEGSVQQKLSLGGSGSMSWPPETERQFHLLHLLKELGYGSTQIESLRKQIPKIRDYIRAPDPEAQAFVSFVNELLPGDNPVTVVGTFERLRDTGRVDEDGNVRKELFELSALVESDNAGIIDSECFYTEEEPQALFVEIAKLGGTRFQVQASDANEQYVTRLVVGSRAYAFDVDTSCSWYDILPACEVLNTIARRQRINERFVIFPLQYGSWKEKLIVFADSTTLAKLVEHWGHQPEPGAELNWNKSQVR